MTFNDIFKSSFLESITEFSAADTLIAMVAALVIGMFIFVVYKKTFNSVMYSTGFAMTLVGMTMVTTLVILAVTSNVVLSLGMVGALSIVRFRAAIKEPMEIVYLFWAVAAGIVIGAGMLPLAVIGSAIIGVILILFANKKIHDNPYLLILNCQDENAENTAKELEAMGVKAKGYASNAANFEDTAKVVEEIHKDFGRIDILVNNAGITRDGLMMRMSEQQWDMVINVNLKSAFNFIHACTPVMMRQKAGSIINMASVVGVHGNAGQANYAASKAGMIALAKSIAQELGSRGIRANAIAPGFILTDMTAALSDEVRAEWAKKIPLRRGGTPEDVANIATFLASDMSSYVSGQVIQVDGGMNM